MMGIIHRIKLGTSLAFQGLRLCASEAVCGPIPGRETKDYITCYMVRPKGEKTKTNKNKIRLLKLKNLCSFKMFT